MEEPTGIIYIRNNELCVLKQIIKIGITGNGKNRGDAYTTYEHVRGTFIMVIEIPLNRMKLLDKSLKNYFKEYNDYKGGGTEYYDVCVIDKIVPYLESMNIKFKVLSREEIDTLERKYRLNGIKRRTNISEIIDNLDINRFIQKLKINKQNKQQHFEKLKRIDRAKKTFKRIRNSLVKTLTQMSTTIRNKTKFIDELKIKKPKYTPREDQIEIINKAFQYFIINDKGLLVLICGIGKTLISLWITQRLNSQTILIGVPNLLLVEQWKGVISKLFPTFKDLILIVSCGENNENIMRFLENNQKKCIVITTYSSAHKVYTATRDKIFVFDMKILDEVHHLTTYNMRLAHTTKKYIQMLNIPSVKQLSLTATLKNLESMCDDGIVVSNDNVDYFGEIIDRKTLLWAINEEIICEYVIQTIITNEKQLEQQLLRFKIKEENDKRLFLSAFASLKSIFDGHSHHLLVYSNNKTNSLKLIKFIRILLNNYFNKLDLYYSNYDSGIKSTDQKKIIDNFETSKFGIIACVYCLGEGWDFPLLDAVVFAENMTSNIRIVQSALRASRINEKQPNKITKIILPILNSYDSNNENPDLKKVKKIIYQMGLEDETINQKIKVFRINIEIPKQKFKTIEKKESEPVDEYGECDDFGEYDDELTKILILSTIKRTQLDTSYEKAKKIIADKSIKSKESYYELCERDNRLSKEPEIVFKGQFTNWIEYLSIERVYYDFETCKNKVSEYLSNEINIDFEFTNITKSLKVLDDSLPPYDLWCEYYDINDLTEIIKQNKNEELVEF